MHDDGQAATRELVGRCGRRARAFHLWEGVSPPPVVFAANPRAARYRAKRSRRQTSLGCNARGSRRAAALGEGSATGAITLSRRGRGFDSALGAVGTFPSTSTCCWSREQLRETERGVRFGSDRSGHRGLACVRTMASFAKGRLRAFIRSRIEARASRRCASPLAIASISSIRLLARPRHPALTPLPKPSSARRPAGTTRFSSSPLSSPSPPSFLPSDSHLACHPTALSTAPNPDADSSRRGLVVTTPAGFAGAVGRFTPSPSCTSSWASPSSATTSSHHRSSSSARD